MRVTGQTKATTRRRILDAARRLLASEGFDATTTRDIADAAGIASGTLFNYFATKEAVLAALALELLEDVHDDALGEGREDDSAGTLEEDLFAFIAAVLRKLRPLRKHLAGLLETALSPLATCDGEAQSLRSLHLEIVSRLAKKHRWGELSAVALQLYWTLYTGLLMFWANDRSHKQEDTLALLDESLAMFIGWLRSVDQTGVKPCPP